MNITVHRGVLCTIGDYNLRERYVIVVVLDLHDLYVVISGSGGVIVVNRRLSLLLLLLDERLHEVDEVKVVKCLPGGLA
jgi:hypothetical protein